MSPASVPDHWKIDLRLGSPPGFPNIPQHKPPHGFAKQPPRVPPPGFSKKPLRGPPGFPEIPQHRPPHGFTKQPPRVPPPGFSKKPQHRPPQILHRFSNKALRGPPGFGKPAARPRRAPAQRIKGFGCSREWFVGQNLSDYTELGELGEGSFGRVILAGYSADGGKDKRLVAIKKIIKYPSRERKILLEQNIMKLLDEDCFVKLLATFETDTTVSFVLEVASGGSLWDVADLDDGYGLNEYTTRFYAASIVLAIEKMHEKNIIHRDLKPENILIDHEGYVKLADFGLSTFFDVTGTGKLKTDVAGTIPYMAPEVIDRIGHFEECDWWSFGCVLYELLTCKTPFEGRDTRETEENIRNVKVVYPCTLSWYVVDLLKKLLEKNHVCRLGFGEGASEIKRHRWFSGFDWEALESRTLPAPKMPNVDHLGVIQDVKWGDF